MAEKISTIILKVDLECCHCKKKIKKVLCKYQDRWNIKSIVYDEKNNTVTITGPFDPKKLAKKLCCKACKVIKEIQIVENKPPPPPKETKPAPPPEPEPKPKPEPPPPVSEPAPAPAPAPAPPPPEPEPEPAPAPPVEVPAPPPPEPEPEPPKVEANPPPPEPEVQAPEPVAKAPEPVEICEPVQPASQPACPPCWPHGNGPPCCCWYHGTCQCCTCGRGWGPYGGYGLLPVAVVAPPTVVYGGRPCCDGYKTCELIWEEGNSCSII